MPCTWIPWRHVYRSRTDKTTLVDDQSHAAEEGTKISTSKVTTWPALLPIVCRSRGSNPGVALLKSRFLKPWTAEGSLHTIRVSKIIEELSKTECRLHSILLSVLGLRPLYKTFCEGKITTKCQLNTNSSP
jgi:hypothetical protein